MSEVVGEGKDLRLGLVADESEFKHVHEGVGVGIGERRRNDVGEEIEEFCL